jgi:superfamily II DNA or RNA helicase
MLTLYPDQQEFFDALRAAFQTHRHVLAQAATGFGKTIVGCKVAQGAAAKGTRTAFLVHRQELIDQTCASFDQCGIDHGIIAAGYPTRPARIQVAMIQTLARRGNVGEFDLLVVDEAHHAVAGQWRTVSDRYPDAAVLGLTATPARLDGQGLGDVFSTMVQATPMRELIQMGRLSPYEYWAPEVVDTSSLRVGSKSGDYSHEALEKALAARTITGNVIEHYKRCCDGQPFICFCVSVDHARRVAEEFRAAGYPVQSVDGTMDRAVRKSLVRGLGRTLCGLTSCDLISEGLDVPATVAAILLRPSASLCLALQQMGRALRVCPGKTHAVILDCVGNYLRHQMPDTPREWTLERGVVKPAREGTEAPDIRACPKCYAVHEWGPACPYCGHIYEVPCKKEPKIVPGDLSHLTPAQITELERLYLAAQKSKSDEDWAAYARARGYSPGWVWQRKNFWQRRQAGRELKNLRVG